MARPTLFKNLATQRQIVGKITPSQGTVGLPTFPDYFTQIAGGEITASVEKVYHLLFHVLGYDPFFSLLVQKYFQELIKV